MTIPHFDRCAPLLQRAIDRSGKKETVEGVRARIASGQAQFWPGEKSVIVSEIVTDDNGRGLGVWLASGDLGEIFAMFHGINAFARVWGCSFMFVHGERRGWARVVRQFGMRPVGDVLRMEI